MVGDRLIVSEALAVEFCMIDDDAQRKTRCTWRQAVGARMKVRRPADARAPEGNKQSRACSSESAAFSKVVYRAALS